MKSKLTFVFIFLVSNCLGVEKIDRTQEYKKFIDSSLDQISLILQKQEKTLLEPHFNQKEALLQSILTQKESLSPLIVKQIETVLKLIVENQNASLQLISANSEALLDVKNKLDTFPNEAQKKDGVSGRFHSSGNLFVACQFLGEKWDFAAYQLEENTMNNIFKKINEIKQKHKSDQEESDNIITKENREKILAELSNYFKEQEREKILSPIFKKIENLNELTDWVFC